MNEAYKSIMMLQNRKSTTQIFFSKHNIQNQNLKDRITRTSYNRLLLIDLL